MIRDVQRKHNIEENQLMQHEIWVKRLSEGCDSRIMTQKMDRNYLGVIVKYFQQWNTLWCNLKYLSNICETLRQKEVFYYVHTKWLTLETLVSALLFFSSLWFRPSDTNFLFVFKVELEVYLYFQTDSHFIKKKKSKFPWLKLWKISPSKISGSSHYG